MAGIAFVILVLLAARFASGKVKEKGYDGLWDFTSTVVSNYWKGRNASVEEVAIEIKEKDLKKLEKNRNAALERGLIINDMDGDYVPAELTYKGKKMKVKLRLKGHMTDHLQNDKWSFRIRVKDKKDAFMGMKLFSFQHPGTRGYVYEWIYHELMKKEDIIALRYEFINVTVNGRDWGVYAVEENFDEELIDHNNRVKGPILRFNPDLYWVARYNQMTRSNSYDEFASYYSANPEAYRESKVLKDSIQKGYYLKALALIEGLRNGKIKVHEAFDVPRMAKFHAIIDLVGGAHSIDWSDIKYYFNPVTSKFEPVAYESFTNLDSRDIAGQYKFMLPDSSAGYPDWHVMIFSDPVFYREYAAALERVSDPQYLDEFFAGAQKELDSKLAILYKEFPYKKFDKDGYYRRQRIIKKILSPPKALHAYLGEISGDKISIQAAPIDALPVEVLWLNVNGTQSDPVSYILPAKQPDEFLKYMNIDFTMPAGFRWNNTAADSAEIGYSILGSAEIKKAKVFPFQHTDQEYIKEMLRENKSTVSEFSFLTIDDSSKTILFPPKAVLIDKDLVIPAGYTVLAQGGTSITLNNARIISYSSLCLSGSEDEPVIVKSLGAGAGIRVLSAKKCILKNVVFQSPDTNKKNTIEKGFLTFYESEAALSDCSFYNFKSENVLSMIRSEFTIAECLFHETSGDAVDVDFSRGKISNCAFESCGENALDLFASDVELSSVSVNGSLGAAINIKDRSEVTGKKIILKNVLTGISSEDGSKAELSDVPITSAGTGLIAFKNKPSADHPVLKVSMLTTKEVKKEYLLEKKSVLIINGTEATETTENIESLLKQNEKK
ncbi:MAG: right-handed parallel beta-helix repeat-containing protein [Bacteroidia bacterium]